MQTRRTFLKATAAGGALAGLIGGTNLDTLGAIAGDASPGFPIRECYCPAHFGNSYEAMGPREMAAYLAEMKWMGFNRYADWMTTTDICNPYTSDATWDLAKEQLDRKKKAFRAAQDLGFGLNLIVTPNHVYLDQLRPHYAAVKKPKIFGQLVCPSQPEARQLILQNFERWFGDLADAGLAVQRLYGVRLRLRRLRLRQVPAVDPHVCAADEGDPRRGPAAAPGSGTVVLLVVVDAGGAHATERLGGSRGARLAEGRHAAHRIRPNSPQGRAAAGRLPQAGLCPHRLRRPARRGSLRPARRRDCAATHPPDAARTGGVRRRRLPSVQRRRVRRREQGVAGRHRSGPIPGRRRGPPRLCPAVLRGIGRARGGMGQVACRVGQSPAGAAARSGRRTGPAGGGRQAGLAAGSLADQGRVGIAGPGHRPAGRKRMDGGTAGPGRPVLRHARTAVPRGLSAGTRAARPEPAFHAAGLGSILAQSHAGTERMSRSCSRSSSDGGRKNFLLVPSPSGRGQGEGRTTGKLFRPPLRGKRGDRKSYADGPPSALRQT